MGYGKNEKYSLLPITYCLLPILSFKIIVGAGITQLVECKLPKLDAAGSSPVARSIYTRLVLDISGSIQLSLPQHDS